MYKIICSVFICILLMSYCHQEIEAECCYRRGGLGRCYDGSVPTPFCGVRQCNLFGCQCSGGCRGIRRQII